MLLRRRIPLDIAAYGHAGLDLSVVYLGRRTDTGQWACVWTTQSGTPAGVWSDDLAEIWRTFLSLTSETVTERH